MTTATFPQPKDSSRLTTAAITAKVSSTKTEKCLSSYDFKTARRKRKRNLHVLLSCENSNKLCQKNQVKLRFFHFGFYAFGCSHEYHLRQINVDNALSNPTQLFWPQTLNRLGGNIFSFFHRLLACSTLINAVWIQHFGEKMNQKNCASGGPSTHMGLSQYREKQKKQSKQKQTNKNQTNQHTKHKPNKNTTTSAAWYVGQNSYDLHQWDW